ncbi:o-succinylbenzoate synthase [Arcanobacterium phocae]|uniref:o-succinylbenzoate synthase n=1 Tax=Arcanobacterium phocae TaxID=131112 RepID=UPI0020A0FBF3|nr:o-succinylbenzoate synthase [Arcanobacterium phocae]
MYLDVYIYSSPLHTRFRGLTTRDGLLIHGPAGWGETSPFWDYGPQYSAAWLRAGVEAATQGYPEPLRHSIPVNVTVPATTTERAFQIAARGGCITAKVKVGEPGQSLADDVSRVAAVREALGPAGKIRVDVNGAWSVAEACDAIPALDRAAGGLEYVEQPVADVEDLARVRRQSNVPIAADESIRRASDPMRVKKLAAADIVVVKNQPLGGVQAALAIAHDIELPVVVSSALESSIGIRAGLAFAAALPELNHACGLATSQLWVNDPTPEPLLPVDGQIQIRDVAPSSLPAPEPELAARWQERLAQMWTYAGIDASYTLHTDAYIREGN